MSKIERALRKAEEERRKRTPTPPLPERPAKDLLVTPAGLTENKLPGQSDSSEHFRKIAAKLKFCGENVGATDMIFASAVSGEGKTTNAINCAISLCQDFNMSVCLVDGDLRNPKISRYFSSDGERAALNDVLRNGVDIMAAVAPTEIRGLSIVPSEQAGKESIALLNSETLRKAVQELRRGFDFVLFDSPPVLPVADTAVLSKQVSGIVLIVESGVTRRRHIEQIIEQVDEKKILGFIMNFKNHRMPREYNYSKYYDHGAQAR